MAITKLWFIETNDFDDVLIEVNIDSPFDELEPVDLPTSQLELPFEIY